MSGRRHDNRGASPYPRSLRVNQVLREVLAEELERLADADERLRLVTVTSVDTARDLRHATVFLSSLSDDGADALAERRSQLQHSLSRQLRLKRTPLLAFEVDPAVISGGRVEDVLRRIRAATPDVVGDVDSPSDPADPTIPANSTTSTTPGESAQPAHLAPASEPGGIRPAGQ